MNFRSFIALSEGSMEKSLLLASLHQQGRPPAPIASATPQPKLLPVIFQTMITGSFG